MATASPLNVFVGEGPWAFNLTVLEDGVPMFVDGSTVVPVIVIKSSPDQINPASSSPNYFSVGNGGLAITNEAEGLLTWTVPADLFTEPGVLAWNGTVTYGGASYIFGFGTINVLAV